MLGSRTQGGRMEGSDESTELWPSIYVTVLSIKIVLTLCQSKYLVESSIGTIPANCSTCNCTIQLPRLILRFCVM